MRDRVSCSTAVVESLTACRSLATLVMDSRTKGAVAATSFCNDSARRRVELKAVLMLPSAAVKAVVLRRVTFNSC